MTDLVDMMVLSPRAQAAALAAALTRRGYIAMRLTTAAFDRNPTVQITWGTSHKSVHEHVYVATDEDGVWWFYSEEMEPIAPAVYVSVAVEIIAAQIAVRRLRLYTVHVI